MSVFIDDNFLMEAVPPEDRRAVAERAKKYPHCAIALGEGHDRALDGYLTALQRTACEISPRAVDMLAKELRKDGYLFGTLDATKLRRVRPAFHPDPGRDLFVRVVGSSVVLYDPSTRSTNSFPFSPTRRCRPLFFRSIPERAGGAFGVERLDGLIRDGVRHIAIDLRRVSDPYAIAALCDLRGIYLTALSSPEIAIGPSAKRRTLWRGIAAGEWIKTPIRPSQATIDFDIKDTALVVELLTEVRNAHSTGGVRIRFPVMTRPELDQLKAILTLGFDVTDDFVFIDIVAATVADKEALNDILFTRGFYVR